MVFSAMRSTETPRGCAWYRTLVAHVTDFNNHIAVALICQHLELAEPENSYSREQIIVKLTGDALRMGYTCAYPTQAGFEANSVNQLKG